MTNELKLKLCLERKHKVYLFMLVFSLLLFNSCGSLLDSSYGESKSGYSNFRSSSYDRMPTEPGKCYVKCLIPDKYETFEEELLIYTGDNVDVEGVKLETIIFRPGSTTWEKVKDNNCRSRNPDDCYVWCLKEVPEISNDYYIVTDTTIIDDYRVEIVNQEALIEAGGYTEWKEVVCAADVTEEFYRNVQLALMELGYLMDIIPDGKISKSTKEALVRCQKENGLPVGSFNMETIEFLEIEF